MFPRDDGPLVSVLIPTRGRPKHLCEAIDSVYSLAQDKSLIEFILKIDDDYLETINVSNRLSAVLPLKVVVSPRGNGYHDMHHWVNDMCAIATGDWLFLFNDDARMTTENWEQSLLQLVILRPGDNESRFDGNDVCSLVVHTEDRPQATEFMFVRRKVYEILGHYSLWEHCDAWMNSVMSSINSSFVFPSISIKHLDNTIIDNTREDVEKAYIESGNMITTKLIKERIKDSEKLIDYIINYIMASP